MKRINRRRPSDTPLRDLMRKIGIKPPCDLTETERRAIAYAKQSQQQMRTREHARREREKEAAE